MDDLGRGIALEDLQLARGRIESGNVQFALEALGANITLEELLDLLDIDDSDGELAKNYAPTQLRDSRGRWSDGGGTATASPRITGELTEQEFDKIANMLDDGRISDSAYHGDDVLAQIYKLRNINAKPEVLPQDYFEEKLGSKQPLYRGIVEDDADNEPYTNQFKYGSTNFAGRGIFGNGTYASPDWDRAMAYSNTGNVVRMFLNDGAKGIKYDDLYEKVIDWKDRQSVRISMMKISGNKVQIRRANRLALALRRLADPGVYAAAMGYDYIIADRKISSTPHYVILNRGALTVDAEPYDGQVPED